jgi:hypothetical protein
MQEDRMSVFAEPGEQYATVRQEHGSSFALNPRPWHPYRPEVGDSPHLFAYQAQNGCDGVCLIECIEIPDGRIVVACIEIAGNPGNSITNCQEALAFQVCEKFEIPPERLVYLEHYDYYEPQEWTMITFARRPPHGPFEAPHAEPMTAAMWKGLRLRPLKKLEQDPVLRGRFLSKLARTFKTD